MLSVMNWVRKHPNILIFTIMGIVIVGLFVDLFVQKRIANYKLEKEKANEYQRGLDEAEGKAVIKASNEVTITVATLREVIANSDDLTSSKYYYTDIGTHEKDTKLLETIKVPFSTDQIVFSFSGVIGAGIRLSDVDFDINDKKKIITIHFPKPEILSHEIDEKSFQFYGIKDSLITTESFQDFVDLQDKLKREQVEKVNANEEFWKTVRTNAQNSIVSIIQSTKTVNEYTFQYEWESDTES